MLNDQIDAKIRNLLEAETEAINMAASEFSADQWRAKLQAFDRMLETTRVRSIHNYDVHHLVEPIWARIETALENQIPDRASFLAAGQAAWDRLKHRIVQEAKQ